MKFCVLLVVFEETEKSRTGIAVLTAAVIVSSARSAAGLKRTVPSSYSIWK